MVGWESDGHYELIIMNAVLSRPYNIIQCMNLVNSKVIKSSRPIINRSIETVAAFSCELYIESFRIVHRGYVYFMWTSNNAQIHSLRY